MTEVDRDSLIALCLQWSQFVEAQSNIKIAGMVVRSPVGYPMPNPYISIANRSLGNCLRLWAEFGITPSARGRLTIDNSSEDDEFAEFDEPPRWGPS
jgi:P27 family predicted phage terminase small subunit